MWQAFDGMCDATINFLDPQSPQGTTPQPPAATASGGAATAHAGMPKLEVAPPAIVDVPTSSGHLAQFSVHAGDDTVLAFLHRLQGLTHDLVPEAAAVRLFVVLPPRVDATAPGAGTAPSTAASSAGDAPAATGSASQPVYTGASLIGSGSSEYQDMWWSSADPTETLSNAGRRRVINRKKQRVFRRWGKFSPGASIAANTGYTLQQQLRQQQQQPAASSSSDGTAVTPSSGARMDPGSGSGSGAVVAGRQTEEQAAAGSHFVIDNAVDSHLYNGNVDVQADGFVLVATPCVSRASNGVVAVVEVSCRGVWVGGLGAVADVCARVCHAQTLVHQCTAGTHRRLDVAAQAIGTSLPVAHTVQRSLTPVYCRVQPRCWATPTKSTCCWLNGRHTTGPPPCKLQDTC